MGTTRSNWLTWPYRDESFPGKLESIYPSFMQFIRQISLCEKVRIKYTGFRSGKPGKELIAEYEIDIHKIEFFSSKQRCLVRDHALHFLLTR